MIRHITVFFISLSVIARGASQAGETATLLGQHALLNPGSGADVWGYVDPNTNGQYALVGELNPTTGVLIIDVTDPANPTLVAQASAIKSFDMKVWNNYLYVVTGSRGTNEARIFDLSDVRSPKHAGAFESAHNIFIDERGSLYLSLAGEPRELRIYDVSANPTSPSLIWFDGIRDPHDTFVVGTTLYDFHGTSGTRIYDVRARASPFLLGVIQNGEFHHSGMPTEDGKHLFITQELARHPKPDVTIWNIEDPANPLLVGEIADSNATVHNLYIIGRYAYASYYTAGFRVYDVIDPARPVLVAQHDTSPLAGEAIRGCFGVYPFAPTGHIYASDMDNGLFVFSFSGATSSLVSFFDAAFRENRVNLRWGVGAAAGLQGFHVYRSKNPDEGFQRINPDLLPPDGAFAYEDTGIEFGRTSWYRLGVVTMSGELFSRTVGVAIPAPRFALFQNAPNPFSAATTLRYDLPADGRVELAVYNALGQRVRTLVSDFRPAGPHSEIWDGRDDLGRPVATGVYFARLSAGGSVGTKRVTLVK